MSLPGSTLNRIIKERLQLNALTGSRPQIPPPAVVPGSVNPPKAMGPKAKFCSIFTSTDLLGEPSGAGQFASQAPNLLAQTGTQFYTLNSQEVTVDWVVSDRAGRSNSVETFYVSYGHSDPSPPEVKAQQGKVPPVLMGGIVATGTTSPSANFFANPANVNASQFNNY